MLNVANDSFSTIAPKCATQLHDLIMLQRDLGMLPQQGKRMKKR